MRKIHDFLVVGGGSAGVAAAIRAASYGKRVGLIEKSLLGGTCVNLGCVPKKLMWFATSLIEDMKVSDGFGVKSSYIKNFEILRRNRDEYVKNLNRIYLEMLENTGIEIIRGNAEFELNGELVVNGVECTAAHRLIATGSRSAMIEVLGKEFVKTSDDFFAMEKLPEKVLIIGNGYIAAELAGIFNGFGVDTTISIRGSSFLTNFDNDIGAKLEEIYLKQGIKILKNSKIQSVCKNSKGFTVNFPENTSEYDLVFSAIGRTANIDEIKLENIGIRVENSSIWTDEFENTSIKGIYAVGDVTNNVKLTPVASAAGTLLADRLFGNQTQKFDYSCIPSVVFSHPPIGTIGISEHQARKTYGDIKVYKTCFDSMFYALSSHKIPTFMKLICVGSEERIVGIHVIGRGADEMMQGFAVAVKMQAKKKDFDNALPVHPTASEELITLI